MVKLGVKHQQCDWKRRREAGKEGSREGEEEGGKKKREENEIKDIGWKERKERHYLHITWSYWSSSQEIKKKKEPTARKLQDTWSTQNILIFLFSSNEKSKNKIKKTIPFIIVSKRIWG